MASHNKYDTVELIPWDPTDEAHCQRMYQQRVTCAWDCELIEEWKTKVLEGHKFMYWIKLRNHVPGGDDKFLEAHHEKCPEEREPLVDTAVVFANTARTPTGVSFVPIGHISLDLFPERNVDFSLPESTVWIKSFYISRAIQGGGFGRAAMFQIERIASQPPLNVTTIALDTMPKEFQLNDKVVKGLALARGEEPPKDARSNEEWYQRQGYELIGRRDGMYEWMHPVTNKAIAVSAVFMKKDIV